MTEYLKQSEDYNSLQNELEVLRSIPSNIDRILQTNKDYIPPEGLTLCFNDRP